MERPAMGRERIFSITTLGCKLNQYESECIRQDLVRTGWEYHPFEEGAEFFIINTCTVTSKTDSRCRNAVRRARRISPEAVIIVTGCYAETQPRNLELMKETDLVIGNDGKKDLVSIMEKMVGGNEIREGSPDSEIDSFLDHSRAFIKVQEGCDSACTYCIIPRARGRSRSIEPGKVLSQVITLERNGIEEIVLTGIHIGRYGRDIGGRTGLDRLIETILERTEKLRIRMSSIEVNEITPRLIELAAGSERVASHLHIPLQSGDDEILRAMNRPYTSGLFRKKIEDVKRASESIAVGTDIIVGFPGETDGHFRNTRSFLKDLAVDYFHVFSFSRRPGTPADRMGGQVDPEKRKSRSRKLIRMGKRKRRLFSVSRVGTKDLALLLGKTGKYSRFSRGLTGNYCEVSLKSPDGMKGKLVPVEITHYSRGRLYGRIDGVGAGAGTEETGRRQQ